MRLIDADALKAKKVPIIRTGEWRNGLCTNCGGHAPFWQMASTYYQSNYCPNCGARMDGERRDEE